MYVCTRASFYWATGLLSLSLAFPPALKAEEEASPSANLQSLLLSDDDISQRCAASIKGKLDLVESEDEAGQARRVPRCVQTYETMRRLAKSYLTKEDHAKLEVSATQGCGDETNQKTCLDAGAKLAEKAAGLHEALSATAAEAEETLAQVR